MRLEANDQYQIRHRCKHQIKIRQEFFNGVKEELYEAMRRKIIYEGNAYKLYALLWEGCAKAMKKYITSRLYYDSLVYINKIALL